MTEQLYNQRTDLLRANTQLESRRRFTETVLSGVTAGVIGIDKEERIFLYLCAFILLLATRGSFYELYTSC